MKQTDKIKGISLVEYGINNYAYDKKGILQVIKNLSERNIPILGGDVLIVSKGNVMMTDDNWYCERIEGEDSRDFCIRSCETAKRYVEKFTDNTNYFSIVIG